MLSAYVPSIKMVEANEESRRMNLDAERQINPELLTYAFKILDFEPDVGLFAGRINCQCPRYAAYRADPEAVAVNAVSHSWAGMTLYTFRPFCVLPRLLQKIGTNGAQGVVVVPYWLSRSWFPHLGILLTEKPALEPPRWNLLKMPEDPNMEHLLICKVSGVGSGTEYFRGKQLQWFARH